MIAFPFHISKLLKICEPWDTKIFIMQKRIELDRMLQRKCFHVFLVKEVGKVNAALPHAAFQCHVWFRSLFVIQHFVIAHVHRFSRVSILWYKKSFQILLLWRNESHFWRALIRHEIHCYHNPEKMWYLLVKYHLFSSWFSDNRHVYSVDPFSSSKVEGYFIACSFWGWG